MLMLNGKDLSNFCKECGSNHLIMDYERGELFCPICGTINNDFMIALNEKHYSYDFEGKNVYFGASTSQTLYDKGLTTVIDWKDRDANGNKIPYKNSIKMHRLRKIQFMTKFSNSREKNLLKALAEINRISQKMDLPRSLRESAIAIYKKAINKNLIRGHSIIEIATASLYLACRQCRVPRAIDEICKFSTVKRKKIGRATRFLKRELNIAVQLPTPIDYIARFCSKLKLDIDVKRKSIDILERASKKGLISGKEPHSLAGASIYIASLICNQKRLQREIAKISGVSEVTIRKRYKELVEKLSINI